MKYDIAYSLNASEVIEASSYEEAEKILVKQLESKGIDFEQFNLDVFDVNEEE